MALRTQELNATTLFKDGKVGNKCIINETERGNL